MAHFHALRYNLFLALQFAEVGISFHFESWNFIMVQQCEWVKIFSRLVMHMEGSNIFVYYDHQLSRG